MWGSSGDAKALKGTKATSHRIPLGAFGRVSERKGYLKIDQQGLESDLGIESIEGQGLERKAGRS